MLRRIAVAVVTAVRRSLVRLGVPLLVMGTADIFVQTRGDDATIDAAAVTVILGHAALVATVLVPFLAVLDLMTPDPTQRRRPPGAAHPTALSVLAALGTGFVYLNRTTFTGAGLAAKTDPHVVEGIVVAVGLVALFIVIRVVHVAAWRRAHGRRNVIVMIVLFAGAVGASLADRLVLPGQYRPVHLQLFLGGIFAGAGLDRTRPDVAATPDYYTDIQGGATDSSTTPGSTGLPFWATSSAAIFRHSHGSGTVDSSQAIPIMASKILATYEYRAEILVSTWAYANPGIGTSKVEVIASSSGNFLNYRLVCHQP